MARELDCGVEGVTIKVGTRVYLVEVVEGRRLERIITTTAIDASVPTEALLAIVADRDARRRVERARQVFAEQMATNP